MEYPADPTEIDQVTSFAKNGCFLSSGNSLTASAAASADGPSPHNSSTLTKSAVQREMRWMHDNNPDRTQHAKGVYRRNAVTVSFVLDNDKLSKWLHESNNVFYA